MWRSNTAGRDNLRSRRGLRLRPPRHKGVEFVLPGGGFFIERELCIDRGSVVDRFAGEAEGRGMGQTLFLSSTMALASELVAPQAVQQRRRFTSQQVSLRP